MDKEYQATMQEIIQEFKIPAEYHLALWKAYSAGCNKVFVKTLKGLPYKLVPLTLDPTIDVSL